MTTPATANALRRALVGEFVQLPDGTKGRISGINADNLLARVLITNGTYRDVPCAELIHLPKRQP